MNELKKKYYAIDESGCLSHYGVKGMKWHKHLMARENDTDKSGISKVIGNNNPKLNKYQQHYKDIENSDWLEMYNYSPEAKETIQKALEIAQKNMSNPTYKAAYNAIRDLQEFCADPNNKNRPRDKYIALRNEKAELARKLSNDALNEYNWNESNKKLKKESKFLDNARTKVPSNVANKLRTEHIKPFYFK